MSMKLLIHALEAGKVLSMKNYWIEIEYPTAESTNEMKLRYGSILSSGEREQAIGTIRFDECLDGTIVETKYTHR